MQMMITCRLSPLFTLLFLMMISSPIQGQISHGGEPATVSHQLDMPDSPGHVAVLDKEMLVTRDQQRGVHEPGVAPHAGFAIPASLSPLGSGQWEVIGNELHLWRIKIQSPGALATGVNFSHFRLEEGARLFVFDSDRQVVLGSFDHRNNRDDLIFSTAVVPGESIILEYQEPWHEGKADAPLYGILEVESVIHLSYGGTLNPLVDTRDIGDSGPCMVNINCSEGDHWQDEKRGVARMLMRSGSNYSWCTGSLVNNTRQDGTPYFLSAEHCGRNASEEDMIYWQFYFNLELLGCPNEGFPPINMVYGANNIALGPLEGGSDFRLLLLHQSPPPHWRPYWNGWDRTDDGSDGGVGIHHPRGDVKKISTYASNLVSSAPLVSGQQMADNSAWRVIWTPTQNGHGVSEGGSSGSPIFNTNKKIIGTLTGGSSNCDNPYAFDYYGKMWYHWDQNGLSWSQRLDHFLDPLNTGAESLTGLDPYQDLQPSPGFVNARLMDEENVMVSWYAPGNAPNLDGWYRYVDNYTHLTWSGPRRVTVFDAPALGLNYPVHLEKVAHTFVEHSSHPWPDDQFRFVIYDTDGSTLLYESEDLTAQHLQEFVYELPETMVFYNYFYVGVNPLHGSNHPSTLMKRVNLGQGYSFSGNAGDWSPHNDAQEGSFAYLTAIYVSDGEGEPTRKTGNLSHLHQENPLPGERQAKSRQMGFSGVLPDSYRLFRNDELIHSSPADQEKEFLDMVQEYGLYRYHATAVYSNIPSAPSNTAYLLKAGDCDQVIDEWPWTEDFDSDFDDGCWIGHSLNHEGWTLTTSHDTGSGTLNPHSGTHFYLMDNAGGEARDEWLITPLMDLSELQKPALRFMFSSLLEDPHETGYLALHVSTGNKGFKKIWDNRRHPLFLAGEHEMDWIQAVMKLERFGGHPHLRLAWQYIGQQAGFFAIDQLEVLDAAPISHNLNVNITPDQSGTVSGAGQYLAGEAVRLIASPNINYGFEAWMDGGNAIGNKRELLYLMPASNKTLTARFGDFPMSADIVEEEAAIRVYPNPARQQVTLGFGQNAGSATIKLYNIHGQKQYAVQLSDVYAGQEKKISTTGFARGIYLLEVTTGSRREVVRLVLTD